MRLGVGGDHAGFSMKGPIIEYLQLKGHQVTDYGTYSEDPVDFPDIAQQVTSAILSKNLLIFSSSFCNESFLIISSIKAPIVM